MYETIIWHQCNTDLPSLTPLAWQSHLRALSHSNTPTNHFLMPRDHTAKKRKKKKAIGKSIAWRMATYERGIEVKPWHAKENWFKKYREMPLLHVENTKKVPIVAGDTPLPHPPPRSPPWTMVVHAVALFKIEKISRPAGLWPWHLWQHNFGIWEVSLISSRCEDIAFTIIESLLTIHWVETL